MQTTGGGNRREFLRGAGTAVAGLALGVLSFGARTASHGELVGCDTHGYRHGRPRVPR